VRFIVRCLDIEPDPTEVAQRDRAEMSVLALDVSRGGEWQL
jgi:hypothetical protein